MGAAEKRNSVLASMLDMPSGSLTVRQLAELIREINREERATVSPANDPEVLYMKPKEVAKMLNSTVRMVQRLAERGELPGKRIGRELRFKREDVQAYIAKKG